MLVFVVVVFFLVRMSIVCNGKIDCFFFFVRIFHFWILASVHQFQEVCMKQKLACMCQIFEQKTIFVMAKKAIAFSLYQWFNQSKVNRNKVCVNLFYSFIVLPKTSFRCHFFGHYFSFTFFFFFFCEIGMLFTKSKIVDC